MNTTIYDDQNRLDRGNFLKFRCRIESQGGADAHRDFTGCYYPRFRNLYIDEVRLVLGEPRLFPAFPLDVYTKPEDGDYYYTADFFVGAILTLGHVSNARDKGVKKFAVTEVDCSRLRDETSAGGDVQFGATDSKRNKSISSKVAENLRKVRDGFIHMASDDAVLGIKDIGRRFRVVDDNGDRKISLPEFKKAVKEAKVDLSDADLRDIFNAFDRNADGTISFEELIEVIRGPMSEARKGVVRLAFRKLDHHGDGLITIQDVAAKYNAKGHAEVAAGRMTESQVLQSFIGVWDNRDRNGEISFAEFCDYYNGVSASIDDDRMFIAIVASAWKL